MRRGPPVRALLPGALLLVSLVASCADTYAEGNRPPDTSFYYPTTVAVLPDTGSASRYALVSSSNFDLRFAAGWMGVVDLQALLTASTPADVIRQQLRLPSFAGPIAGDLETPLAAGERRLAFVAHRGIQMISAIEIYSDGGMPKVSCGVSGSTIGMGAIERRTDCDRSHLIDLTTMTHSFVEAYVDPQDIVDPYAITQYRDEQDQSLHLAVSFLSHLNLNTLLLTFAIQPVGSADLLVPEHVVNLGAATVSQLVARPPPTSPDPACEADPTAVSCQIRTRLVAGSRFYGTGTDQSQLRVVTITGQAGAADTVSMTSHYLSVDVGGYQVAGLVFSNDGQRAYVVNSQPDALVSLDATLATPTVSNSTTTSTVVIDQPRFGVLDVLPLGSEPQTPLYLERAPVPLLTVPRFRAQELDVVAASGAALVSVAVVTTIGSGPFGSSTWRDAAGDDLVLVTTFFDHGLSVVRVPAGDPGAASLTARVRSAELGDATTY